jgi:hypothetical protein
MGGGSGTVFAQRSCSRSLRCRLLQQKNPTVRASKPNTEHTTPNAIERPIFVPDDTGGSEVDAAISVPVVVVGVLVVSVVEVSDVVEVVSGT